MRDLKLVDRLDGFLAISEPANPLSDDASCIALVVPAVRVPFCFERTNAFSASSILSLATVYRPPKQEFEQSEAPFSLILIESLRERARFSFKVLLIIGLIMSNYQRS